MIELALFIIPMPVTAITLVCNPETEAISDDLVDEITQILLETLDVDEIQRRTLGENIAEDFLVDSTVTRAEVEAALSTVLSGEPVDVIVQPAGARKKRLLVADMDSTIIGQECIDELADFAGLKEEISEITARAMRGELDFETALKKRVALLEGLPETALEECFSMRISLNPGARALVATMNAEGAETLLVSGGFTFFVERIARLAGFKSFRANRLGISNGRLTGRVEGAIVGRDAKKQSLMAAIRAGEIDPALTLAVGDGANDLDMIAAAGLGVAYRAKPVLAAAADASLNHADLTALLYAQGLRRADFAPVC